VFKPLNPEKPNFGWHITRL